MELSSIIKNNCIFDLSRGCDNKNCNQRHIPKDDFKSKCTKYINTPSSIPGVKIDVDTFRKIVIEKSKGHKLSHKLMVCLYYITEQECYNCSSGRAVHININYFGHTIPVTVCYRNMSRCKQWCTWGMHVNLIFENKKDRLFYSELQFEHAPIVERKPVAKKWAVEAVEQFPSLASKKTVPKAQPPAPPSKKTVAKAQPPAPPSKKPVAEKSFVDEAVPVAAPVEKPIIRKWITQRRKLPFTIYDLIDKRNEIISLARMRMIRQINLLESENKDFLKRNVSLTDEMNARKLVPRTCSACDHCHKPLGIKRCRSCFINESPQLMSFFYP